MVNLPCFICLIICSTYAMPPFALIYQHLNCFYKKLLNSSCYSAVKKILYLINVIILGKNREIMEELMYKALFEMLQAHGQEHLLKYWDELSVEQQSNLAGEIEDINFDEIDKLIKEYVITKPQQNIPSDLRPPDYYPAKPATQEEKKFYKAAYERGVALVKKSKVAAFTVAGGQGSRLGFDGPKGTYPITPVKNKTLFQYFSEVIIANEKKYGCTIPWYIMTSSLNNKQTQDFFSDNKYFGLNRDNVIFIVQGTMPAMDYTGKIVLESKDSIALAPNGHGGSLLALRKSGALSDMKHRGIEHISYFQVDNPLVSIINPLFIGLHNMSNSEMSSIMLAKTGPKEKLGNFCKSGGKLMIIEYSDLPAELAEKRNEDGSLAFICGSPAIHVIKRDFVERLTESGTIQLPWHRADKKVKCLDNNGNKVSPEKPNGVKLETFIFDALPLAAKTIIFEAKREEEFAPTKNKTGVDSVESCRQMLIDRDAAWIEKGTGIQVPRKENGEANCAIELSRLTYLDIDDIKDNTGKFNVPEVGEEVYFE